MADKNISTRRKILTWAIGIVLMVAWMKLVDHVWPADSATPPTSGRVVRMCPPEGPRCPTAPRVLVKRFNHDRLGRSKGYKLSRHVVRLTNRWYRHHPHAFAKPSLAQRDISDWFKSPLQQFQCATFRTVAGDVCHGIDSSQAVKKDAAKMQRATKQVVVRCSGSAIIGFATGIKASGDPRKALWAAGGGAGVCLWNRVNDSFW